MIISLRGTNGAGKSWIVKQILEQYNNVSAFMVPRRKKPMGYICSQDNCKRLFVPGHYEIANGGIDTIGDLKVVYQLLLEFHELGCDCLYEGMNLSDNIHYLVRMHRAGINVKIIYLDHSFISCVQAVRNRGHNIQARTILSIHNKCENQKSELRTLNIPYYFLIRKIALQKVQEWLGV